MSLSAAATPPRIMVPARLAPLLVLCASVAVLGAALLSQYVGGLNPCELCLYERWAYYASLPLMLLALALGPRSRAVPWLLGLAALGFLGNAGLALYHVAVEQHWVAGPTACSGARQAADSIEALKAQILGTQPIRCDEVQWSLFGVSMAGWDAVASLAIAAFSFAMLPRLRQGRRA